MDKFIVSARKYRPQNFNTVVGQQHITTTLKNAIRNNHLAHAFLFCGPRGVGKTTCARILAKTINCENLQPDGEACNQCHSCKSFEAGTSLNIHELDAASNNSVEDIRDLVEQVRFPPVNGQYKIYIVDEVHMLSSAAFNAFLKTLEEPPAYVKFILATTEKHKILPTILSRCQIFDFRRITVADVVAHLQEIADAEEISAEKNALQVIAQKSEGCMRDALSLLDKIVTFTDGQITYANTLENLNLLDEDYFFRLLDALRSQDLAKALVLYDEIDRRGFEGDVVLSGFAECLRNLLVSRTPESIALLDVLEGMEERYAQMARQLSVNYLVTALNIISEAEMSYKNARNRRLHVELCLIKLAYLQQAIQVTAAAQQGAAATVNARRRVDGPVALNIKYFAEQPVLKPGSLPSLLPEPKIQAMPFQEPELVIEKPVAAPFKPAAPLPKPATPAPAPAAQPVKPVEMPVPLPKPLEPLPAAPVPESVTAPMATNPVVQPAKAGPQRATLLDKLQHQLGSGYHVQKVRNPEPLRMEALQKIWLDYADQLQVQNKHSAANVFRSAPITLETEAKFIVTVGSRTAKSWIDAEKTYFLDLIQEHFFNRSIGYQVVIKTEEAVVVEKPIAALSNLEKFALLAQKYPFLQQLERYGLEVERD